MSLNSTTKRGRKPIDIANKRFGRLVAIEYIGVINRISHWICQCDCGATVTVSAASLIGENTHSCGCLRKEIAGNVNRTHSKSKTPEYKAWCKIIERCDKNYSERQYYADRGIELCQEWRDSFERFLSDMGPRPSAHHSVDRIDNNRGYFPGNCRWATAKTQANNRRSNHLFTHNDESHTLIEWSEIIGINPKTLSTRIHNYHWTIERALTTPVRNSGTHEI